MGSGSTGRFFLSREALDLHLHHTWEEIPNEPWNEPLQSTISFQHCRGDCDDGKRSAIKSRSISSLVYLRIILTLPYPINPRILHCVKRNSITAVCTKAKPIQCRESFRSISRHEVPLMAHSNTTPADLWWEKMTRPNLPPFDTWYASFIKTKDGDQTFLTQRILRLNSSSSSSSVYIYKSNYIYIYTEHI